MGLRFVLQRSLGASVAVDDQVIGKVDGHGFVLLVGVTASDTVSDANYLAEKIAGLRVFEDEQGKMNLDITQVGGSILSISQFTLYGDVRKGRRPNYMDAAPPQFAEPLYDALNENLRSKDIHVETGKFGAMMTVHLVNDGPVTLLLDSKKQF